MCIMSKLKSIKRQVSIFKGLCLLEPFRTVSKHRDESFKYEFSLSFYGSEYKNTKNIVLQAFKRHQLSV